MGMNPEVHRKTHEDIKCGESKFCVTFDLDQCFTPPPVVPERFMPSCSGVASDEFTGSGQELTHVTSGLKKIWEEYISQGETVPSVQCHS